MSLREQYNRDGYVVVRNSLTTADIPVMFDCFNKLYHQDIEKYKSHLVLCAKLPSVHKLFLCETIEKTLVELGLDIPVPPTYPVLNVMGLPIPGGYNGTEAHQDWPSVQGSLDMATVWIPFMDIGIDNYPLEVIPGSHLGGLRDGKLNGSVLEIENVDGFIPIDCRAGDAVIMSGFLIHRTGNGVGFRIAASMRFDNVCEPTFIERNFYCAQRRVVDREIKWRPPVDEVREIYA